MKKKFILLLLVLTMTFGLGMNTYADEPDMAGFGPSLSLHPEVIDDSDVPNADELRQQANNKAAELEQVYGIKIAFEEGLTRAAYLSTQLDYMSFLEDAIKAIPTELYSSARAQLAAAGKTLTVYFYQGGSNTDNIFVRQGGFYTPDTVTIHLNSDMLYMYPSELVKSFLHEYGHMLHFTLLDPVAMESRWAALNGGMEYSNKMWFQGDANASRTFISNYASSSYHEDFAETFAYFIAVPGDVIQQEATKDPGSPIIQKMLLMRETLSGSFAVDPLILLPF